MSRVDVSGLSHLFPRLAVMAVVKSRTVRPIRQAQLKLQSRLTTTYPFQSNARQPIHMHQLFATDDLRYAIADSIARNRERIKDTETFDLLSLSLVNKSCFKPAMCLLWHEVSNVGQLLRLIDPFARYNRGEKLPDVSYACLAVNLGQRSDLGINSHSQLDLSSERTI